MIKSNNFIKSKREKSNILKQYWKKDNLIKHHELFRLRSTPIFLSLTLG